MYICDYIDRLELENGELVRIVTAVARKDTEKKLDVYKMSESGACVCRNLYYSMYGYRVGFPDEINSLYKNGGCCFVQKLEDYCECNEITAFPSRIVSDDERKIIESKYPDFKYILRKYPKSIETTMRILDIWKQHKEIEYVLASGFDKVALSKSFWKLSNAKKKEVCGFMRCNQYKRFTLLDIQTVIKHKINPAEYVVYKDFCFMHRKTSFGVFKYLTKIGKANISGVYLYKDYHSLLVQTSHNKNDDYWKYPKDLQKKRDELREEVKRIDELKKRQNDYENSVKNLFKFRTEIEGYCVYVPEKIEDIEHQADRLHQCLIQCDYVSQVINKSCVLVFIRKNNEPVATVQLLKGDKIGQFYADELDRNNCLPPDEVREVFDKWLSFKRNFKKVA